MKRIIALLSVMVFTIALLVGCGSNKNTATQANNQASASQTASQSNKGDASKSSTNVEVQENGTYTDKDHVAAYVHKFNKLPSNFITKKQAEQLGWKDKGTLDKVAPGKSIGGDRFGNYEKAVPDKQGRSWKEADIGYVKGNRGAKRIVFSNDGLVYYTDDHYKTFKQLY